MAKKLSLPVLIALGGGAALLYSQHKKKKEEQLKEAGLTMPPVPAGPWEITGIGQTEEAVMRLEPGMPGYEETKKLFETPQTPFVTALKYLTYGLIAWLSYGAIGKLTRS